MWSDHESDVDYLNFFETSELISELIINPSLRPVSIGVYGGWGSGKSTLIKLSKDILQKTPDNYIVVDFDAWLYQDFDNARAALLETVGACLLKAAASEETLIVKAKSLLKRIDKLRALGLLAEGGALLMGVPTFGFFNRAIQSVGDIAQGNGDASDLEALKDGAQALKEKAQGLEKTSGGENTPPQEIAAFRAEFSALLDEMNKTLVVYVDNLDRCLPRNAILTLEAIRLVLFMPNTAFVIAADEDMVKLAVSEHYKTSQTRLINDYLDKLIQVPVHVPRLGVAEVASYTFLLLLSTISLPKDVPCHLVQILQDNLKTLWEKPLLTSDELIAALAVKHTVDIDVKRDIEVAYSLANRLAPMLANSRRVAGNPRIIKRMLNTVWMRTSIAKKRNMPVKIDQALLAKIALFERCAGELASTELYRLINADKNGQPPLIAKLEKGIEIPAKEWPEAWEDEEFVNNWIQLAPKLTGVNLKAVAYLARETLPVKLSVDGLSPIAETALQLFLKAQNLSSPSLEDALKKLTKEDYVPVMEAIIDQLRKVTSWDKKPDGFTGAQYLARHSEGAGKRLYLFLSKSTKIPPWMKVAIKDDKWWKEGNQ